MVSIEGAGEILLQCAQFNPQCRGELFSQFRHGVGLGQQAAASIDGCDGNGAGIGCRQANSKALQLQQSFPGGRALGNGVGALLPCGQLGGEVVLLLMDLEQLGISAKHLQGTDILSVWRLRLGCDTAGGFGQGEQFLERFNGCFRLLAVLGGDARFLEKRLEIESLLHVQRGHVDIEGGDTHLVLWQRGKRRLAIQGGSQVAGDQHHEQGAVDGVLWPAVGSSLEVVAQVLALLATAYEFEHTATDWVLGGIALIAHLSKSAYIARSSASNDLTPVGMVSLGEKREEPQKRAAAGLLHLVSQLDAVSLLSATKKDFGATNYLAQQILNAVLSNLQVSLDRLSGLNRLRRARRATGIQRFLCRHVRGDSLLQFFVVESRQVAEQHRAVHTGRTSII